ncbi:hypothetical protein D5274_08745 [bacterium 1XD42-94]|nr:hypothetical protein [bacterium 1XD42-76]NBK05229.1 hypothetical protein [bacterium 1XD42-94]
MLNKKQRDWQVEKIKDDKMLSKGCRLLPAGVFAPMSLAKKHIAIKICICYNASRQKRKVISSM